MRGGGRTTTHRVRLGAPGRGKAGRRLRAPADRVRLGRTRPRKGGRSRPVSRVLSWTVIPLGAPSPVRSSGLPGRGAGQHHCAPIRPCSGWGLPSPSLLPGPRCALTAPFHPCLIPVRGHRRSALCCTFRRLAPPRRYLAPCPVEPGLSSPAPVKAAAATVRSTSPGHCSARGRSSCAAPSYCSLFPMGCLSRRPPVPSPPPHTAPCAAPR